MATAHKITAEEVTLRSADPFGAHSIAGLGSVTVQAVQDEHVATGDSIELCRARLIAEALTVGVTAELRS